MAEAVGAPRDRTGGGDTVILSGFLFLELSRIVCKERSALGAY